MAMLPVWNSTNGTTAATDTQTVESGASSSAPASTSSSEPETPTLCLFGESSLTTPSPSRTGSIATYSETKRPTATDRPSLSDKLTPSLITAGLVRGTTHTSIRKQSGAPI